MKLFSQVGDTLTPIDHGASLTITKGVSTSIMCDFSVDGSVEVPVTTISIDGDVITQQFEFTSKEVNEQDRIGTASYYYNQRSKTYHQ